MIGQKAGLVQPAFFRIALPKRARACPAVSSVKRTLIRIRPSS